MELFIDKVRVRSQDLAKAVDEVSPDPSPKGLREAAPGQSVSGR